HRLRRAGEHHQQHERDRAGGQLLLEFADVRFGIHRVVFLRWTARYQRLRTSVNMTLVMDGAAPGRRGSAPAGDAAGRRYSKLFWNSASGRNSTAPRSQPAPNGRGSLRWSVANGVVHAPPASIAGL